MKSNRRRRGFSLLEVMIVSLILVFVSAALYMMLFNASTTYSNLSTLGDVQERARRVMDEMSKDLRMADGTTCVVTQTVTPNDTITYRLPKIDATTGKVVTDVSGNVTWDRYYQYTFEQATFGTDKLPTNGHVDANNNGVSDEGRIIRRREKQPDATPITYETSPHPERLCNYVKLGGLVFTKTGDNVVISLTFIYADHKNRSNEITLRSSITLRNNS